MTCTRFGGVTYNNITFADTWENFECTETEQHPTDPDCCRCMNHMWDCKLKRLHCHRVNCPESHQVQVVGNCCPVCLEEDETSPDSPASIDSNQTPAPFAEDDSE